MSKSKYGSLFEGLADKSPDIADRLKKMGSGASTNSAAVDTRVSSDLVSEAQPGSAARKRKKPIDRMQGVKVEKRSITPRVRNPKPISKKPPAAHPGGPVNRKLAIASLSSKGEIKTQSSSHPEGRFFAGIPENAHQFGLSDGMSKLDVVIGLDFGTSSTKVVIQAPNFTGSPAYAVPFGELAHDSLQYLLPTRLYVDKGGNCSLTEIAGASVIIDIKMGLMESPRGGIKSVSGQLCDGSAMTIATAYVALVLRYVRCWLIANKRDVFGEYPLIWSHNMGLPAAIDDDPELRNSFNLVGEAAWVASRRSGAVTIKNASLAIEEVRRRNSNSSTTECDFQLIPEVIAEVTGYARSQYRNEGLHLLVDVGASTLDVCSFILHEDEGDDKFPILTADVGLLGTKRLHHSRIDAAKEAVVAHAKRSFDNDDPIGVVADDIAGYVPSNEELSIKIMEAQDNFKEQCHLLICRTLNDLRKNRDPYSPRWKETLPVFVCGGGSAMQFYGDRLAGIGDWLKKFISSSEGARLIHLPKPENLEVDINDDSYHRLAVAWGLSHESFNIGSYCRPSDIDDVQTRGVRRYDDTFVSKDMV